MNSPFARLQADFDAFDLQIATLEDRVGSGAEADLEQTLPQAMRLVADLLRAYGTAHAKPMPECEDLLELFKAFVKGDPSLNAVRDNVRELIFYANCIGMGRRDALPAKPGRMAAHTVRHIYLYLRSRAEQEGLFG